ncbi:PREDICTED: uncharacterized protein LOC108375726 [Rhagoletis zephyria]|uniref:uncharacterized protein LOC108375726 n=1 Tax=Rhagoletis zephyria TaxID=28612 RepID=UPI0008112FF4|nr:PREDICTED: uncharacterized protein LOC108375726 [Rhagoletis zephyria]
MSLYENFYGKNTYLTILFNYNVISSFRLQNSSYLVTFLRFGIHHQHLQRVHLHRQEYHQNLLPSASSSPGAPPVPSTLSSFIARSTMSTFRPQHLQRQEHLQSVGPTCQILQSCKKT